MPTEWDKLRSWNGSQSAAFEELICQLASYEPAPAGSGFVRKGTPDGGVECFWRFPSNVEHGWQAKFFTSSLSASQWGQLDRSVKTALEKHPNLRQYTICMAFDHPDPRLEGAISSRDQWNAHVAKWEGWAAEKGMCVQFSDWGTHEIIERLSRDEHRGRHYFWFSKELFTPTRFQQRLGEMIAAVGPRYTPELNVKLPLSEVFEGVSRSRLFFERFQEAYGDIGKALSKGSLKVIVEQAPEQVERLYKKLGQIIETAKNYDQPGMEQINWSLMEHQAADTLRCISDIHNLIQHLIKEIDNTRSPQKDERTGRLSRKDLLSSMRHSLWRVKEKLVAFREFIKSDIAHLANQPAILLTGEAGTGKTHLFADAAKNHLESGGVAILLLGNQFTKEEPWAQILRMLGLSCTREEFLGALEAAAQTTGKRAIIFIDALNEGGGCSIWKTNLPSMLECVARYPWIAIAVSVRSSYVKPLIPEGLDSDKVIWCVHDGFAGKEYQAAKNYFEHYNIQLPSVPVLTPEFQNPLFLRCLCEGLKDKGFTTIPAVIRGTSSIFTFFLDSVNDKLADPESLDYDPKSSLVHKVTAKLARLQSRSPAQGIQRAEAKAICDEILPRPSFQNSLFNALISEGVLLETVCYDGSVYHQEMVIFAYERLADHLIMRELLCKHVSAENPEGAIANGPLSNYFKDEISCWSNRGLAEALAIQAPETLGKEIFELVPELKDAIPICEAFIESLLWRDPTTISEKCLPYINEYVIPEYDLRCKFFNAILTIASNPEHAFNADLLHRYLMKFEMAERDAWWSIFLHNEYGENGVVDRLIDWAWSESDMHYISDESVRLAGTALVWFLTTSNRFLRDRATKALVSLFVNRIDVLCQVIPTFAKVNDLYVSERLYAVAYGCALRSNDSDAKLSLAQLVYNVVFKDDSPPCHILLRDYARGVVEVALRDGLDLKGVELHKIKPPYKSDWPLEIPPEEDIQWRPYAIDESVMGHGDFSRYILGSDGGKLHWSNRRLDEKRVPSRKERYDAFVESLTDRQKKTWDFYLQARREVERHNQYNTTISSSSENSPSHASVPTVTVNQAERKFRRTLGKKKAKLFSEVVLPYLDASPAEKDELALPVSIAQRWILNRVRNLGWTEDRFEQFDSHVNRYSDAGRGTAKSERIGKKYQWIAYHEFLAHLADCLEFRENRRREKPAVYDGPWQLLLRDIDPSSLRKNTCRSDWTSNVSAWWTPVQFDDWAKEPDATKWRNRLDLLPSIAPLPIVIDPETKQEWFVLECLYDWEEPTPPEQDKFSTSRPYIWYMLKSFLIKSDDEERFCNWAKNQNFMGRWMPESCNLTHVLLGEFPGAPAFEHFNNPYYGREGWTRGDETSLPCEVLVTTDQYLQERGYDCSIEHRISMYLPAKWITDKMNLSQRGEDGCYFDSAGHLVAQDPSVRAVGPGALLMDKDLTTEFLNREGYRLVWTLLGEKGIRGNWERNENFPGLLELSAYMRIMEGQLSGKLTAYWCQQEPEREKIESIDIP